MPTDEAPPSSPPERGDLDAALLHTWLERHDAPCPVCGYNLRRLTGDVCPECGQRFALQIGAVSAHFGYLLASLAPMIMLAGLAGLFGVLLCFEGPPPYFVWGFWVIIVVGILEGAAVPFIYRKRRVFLVQSVRTQVGLVLLSWLYNVLLAVVCFKFGFQ